MKDEVYVIYNKLSNRYESVFSFPTDAVCIHHMQQGKYKRDEYDICKIGSINITDGTLSPINPVRLDIPIVEDKLPVEEAK